MYQLTDDPGVVVLADTGTVIPDGNWLWTQYQDWLAAGNTPEPVPQPTIAQVAAAKIVVLQSWLDGLAQANGYDSMASCCTYVNSTVAKWKADADAGIALRDAVWLAAFAWEQEALANPPAVIPTDAEIIAQMPQPATFNWQQHAPGAAAAASGGTVSA